MEYGTEYLKYAEPAAMQLVEELIGYWEEPTTPKGVEKVLREFKHLMEIGAIRIGVRPSPERSEEISLVDNIDSVTDLTHTVIILDPANAYRRLVLGNQQNLFLPIMYQAVDHYRLLKDSGVTVP